jgi:hypothetical protein
VVTNQEPGWASQNDSEDPASKKKSTKSKKNLTAEDKDKLTATLESVQTDLALLKEAFYRSQQSQGGADNGPSQSQQNKGKFNVIHVNSLVNSLVNRYVTIALSVDQVNILQEGVRITRETATPKGRGVAHETDLSHCCTFCKVSEMDTPFKQCSKCKFFRYCSQACQRKHWNEHKTCNELSDIHEQKLRENFVDDGVYACHLSPRENAVITRLVGRKYTVQCSLNGVKTTALWDTGAQVSIVSSAWLQEHLPKAKIQEVEELLGVNELELKAANRTALPYCAWTEIDFSLLGTNSDYGLKIPFLVGKVVLDLPVVGYNVIEEITRKSAVKVNQDRLRG